MASPIPPDPYVTLGVSSTADLATIRTAHRKLALKHHPDRIRDEAERERGKNEFQKIQQAYEILSDPGRRERYDNKIKLAELQKERILRGEPTRPAPYTAKTTPAPPPVRRETRGAFYEQRAPPDDYFDDNHRFDDPLPRGPLPRKTDSYEKRSPPLSRPVDKKDKASSKWTHPVEGVSMNMAFRMKAKAAQAREKTRENAKKQESRDREKRRERSDKQSHRRTSVDDDYTGSESDTVVPNHVPKSSRSTTSRTGFQSMHSRASPPRRPTYEDEEDSYDEQREKWERHHKASRDYIAESQKRPALARSGSDAYHYWKGDARGGRRSGSDTEKRPLSSRRSAADDTRSRPSMPVHNSAPSGHWPHVVDREPQRSKTANYPTDRDHRREIPSLARSQTMPVHRGGKKEANIPTRGSNLKHGETQDSGYYSSSNPHTRGSNMKHGETQDSGYSSNSTPHTPEMRGDSPTKDLPRENSKRQTSTKYAIVEPASDEESMRRPRLSKMVDSDEDGRPRRYRSPEPDMRERDRDHPRERPERPRLPRLDTDSRSRSARAPEPKGSMPRNEFARYESQSPRGSPTIRGKLFGEMPVEDRDSGYTYRHDPSHLRTASYRGPATANYGNHRIRSDADDEYPTSRFREGVQGGSRRPSVATH